MDDKEQLVEWQKTRDPNLFANLIIRYQPVVNSVVNKYRTVGLAPATLRANATTQLIKAFESYDPNKGTVPTTHIWNNLQKVQRIATESLMSGHIPENRNLKKATFLTVKDNLTDQLGREPAVDELAEELVWDRKEVGRMLNELKGEVTASGAPFDFYGNASQKPSRDRDLADYLYGELDPKQKVIFEYTFGYAGRPILNNKAIAQKLNINEMAVHRMKQDMSQRIREMR